MDHVTGVSWPRSGHHMLVNLLKNYFGTEFSYCSFYGSEIDCCKSLPCKRADKIDFTKSHDFDLSLSQLQGHKYLVQYRDFVPSVVSNFELHVRNGNDDTAEEFRRFCSLEFGRYKAFLSKWVYSDFAREQLVLKYEEFLKEPTDSLLRVASYFEPELRANQERAAAAVSSIDAVTIEKKQVQTRKAAGVTKERNVTDFRYYSPALFSTLERLNLSRGDVVGLFRKHLGRDPAEKNMLALQAYESREALEEFVVNSEEFKRRALSSNR